MHHPSFPVRTATAVGLALTLALSLVACGGGSSGGDAGGTTATTAPTGSGSGGGSTTPTIGYTPDKHDFSKLKGSEARFANFLVVDGKGADIDVYWGTDADTGKKAGTVKYAEVSDWMPMLADQDPLLTPADGTKDVSVAFYRAGKTDRDSLIITQDEPIEPKMRLTYTMGWTKTFDSSSNPGSLGVSFEHKASEAPSGKAWVAFNSGGIGGIDGGDFMVPSTAGACQDLSTSDVGDTANNGSPYVFDPGTVEITASDANTDCSQRTPSVKLDLKAGDRYVLYAYGTSKDDRKLLAVKVGD